MKEVFEFIRDVIKTGIDRLKFPFFNSLIISWIIWNWKPVFIVLFEDWPMHSRIAYVSEEFSNLLYTAYLPLIFAFGYVITTPLLKALFFGALSKVNDFNRKNDYKYYISFATERDHLAQLDYQQSVIKAGNIQAAQMAQEIETLKGQYEKIENEKRLSDKTIQSQLEEINKLNGSLSVVTNERDELDSVVRNEQSKRGDLSNKMSNLETQNINLKSALHRIEKENAMLKEEKNLLLTERDLDRDKIKNIVTDFEQIYYDYEKLVMYLNDKFVSLKKTMSLNDRKDYDHVLEYSYDRMEALDNAFKSYKEKI